MYFDIVFRYCVSYVMKDNQVENITHGHESFYFIPLDFMGI